MAIEFAAIPVFRRAAIESVPLTMLKVAGPFVTTPSRECTRLVLVSNGARAPWPKLNVPPPMSSCAGRVIGAEDELSTSAQFALVSVSSKVFDPPLGAKNKLVRIPTPTGVLLVTPLEVLVQPPPMMSLAVPPLVPEFNER